MSKFQISTIKFETMQPIGVGLLSTIMDKVGHAQNDSYIPKTDNKK